MNFLFGQQVEKVEQKDKSPKQIFILGVYASAVHAKWISPEGKTLINAISVASEPEIFWRGNDAESIISKIEIPKNAGELTIPNKNLNGPSGITLDEKYLKPLGFNRELCWLCDLIPYSMLNAKQEFAIKRNKDLIRKS